MATYTVKDPQDVKVGETPATLLVVEFGENSNNDVKVVEAEAQLKVLEDAGKLSGQIVLVNGPASLPITMVIAHHLAHRFGVVAYYDMKHPVPGGAYIVGIAHGGQFNVGDVIPKGDVTEI